MNANSFEGLLKTATVGAIDGVAKRVANAESIAEKKIGRLLQTWSDLDPEQKEQIAGIAVATITTAVAAILAARRATKSPLKTAARSIVKRVTQKRG